MALRQDTMMHPPIEGLLDRAGSKFSLVSLSATRARQINAYFNQLGEGLGAIVPPQVTSVARRPLSIAFEEIDSDKIVPVRRGTDEGQERGDEVASQPLTAIEGAPGSITGDDSGADAPSTSPST